MENVDRKLVDTSIFTSSDAIEAAQSIFSSNLVNFEELKTRPWYKKLLDAIAGGHKDRKHLHRSIRNLAQLQEIVMNIYITQMQSYDSDFAQVVDQLIKTNTVVEKLYTACVLKIKHQPEIQSLSDSDKELLCAFLSLYGKENELMDDQRERLRKYNMAIALALGTPLPVTIEDISVFSKVGNVNAFYRCAVEQSLIATESIITDPSSVISYLSISVKQKEAICAAIEEEKDTFGIEYFWLKYQKYEPSEDNSVDDPNEDDAGTDDACTPYIIEPKEYIDARKECARAFWQGTKNPEKVCVCESASYVLVFDNDYLTTIHKRTAIKERRNISIPNWGDYIKNKRLHTYQDVLIYVLDTTLYYYDLDTNSNGKMIDLPVLVDDQGSLIPIGNISLYDNKIIFGAGKLYVFDIVTMKLSEVKNHEGRWISGDTKYYPYEGYLYFLSSHSYMDKKDKFLEGNVIDKYGLHNELYCMASKPFDMQSVDKVFEHFTELFHFGVYENYICMVFEYSNPISGTGYRMGFDCRYFDITNYGGEVKPFYIWNSDIYQMEMYRNNLVYINASKDYSVISHNFISDKKRVVAKKFGYSDKSNMMDRLIMGKSFYQHPKKYRLIGEWLCYYDDMHQLKTISVV